jgi:tetratricopeptide (TPR) repeat protein
MPALLARPGHGRSWRTVRVFISSTFRDMQAERDQLVRVTFPALRERLVRHRVSLIDVDLRWGVTRAQAENDQTLGLCLGLVDECRPFFLGLLGERYGLVPETIPADALARFPWLAPLRGRSVTEMEFLHGALNSPENGRALFCLRQRGVTDDISEPLRSSCYVDADPLRVAALADLRDRLRASGQPCLDPYPCRWDAATGRFVGLEFFSDAVRDWLWDAIRSELQLADEPMGADSDTAIVEEDDQTRFVEERLHLHINREEVQRQLHGYVDGGADRPCLVTGPSGCGKSSVLARFVADRAGAISHFVGAGPRSTSLRQLLRRVCTHLQTLAGCGDEPPDGADGLVGRFRELLYRTSPVVIVLDAIDQLDPDDRAHTLHWLPERLPQGVRLLVSLAHASDVPLRMRGVLRDREFAVVEVGPLNDRQRAALMRDIPSLSAKTLDDAQLGLLMENPATRNPLFLQVALEELRVFGVFEELSDRITGLPSEGDAVTGLFGQVLDRLEASFVAEFVRGLLTLLASARRGLSESELHLLAAPLAGVDDFYPILRQLRPYLLDRSGLLGFYHRNLLHAVEGRYLAEPHQRRAAHARLARFFWGAERNARTVEELPWQLAQAGAWDELAKLFGESSFFDASWRQDPFEVKELWARVEAESPWRLVDAYGDIRDNPDRFPADIVGRVATLLADTGHPEEALTLRRHLVSHYRRGSDPARLAVALGNVALLCKRRGEGAQALALLAEAEGIWREVGDRHGLQTVLGNKGRLLMSLGDPDKAMALLEEGEAICREMGNEQGLQISLGSQAQIWLARGEYDRAEAMLGERERICRRLGNPHGLQVALGNLALVLHARGDAVGALELLQESERICRALGNRHGLQIILGSRARVLQNQGEGPAALPILDEQERICREMGNRVGLQIALSNRGLVLRDLGRFGEALELFQDAERICRRVRHPEGLALALHHQAKVLADDLDQPAQARRLAEEALQVAQEHGQVALAAMIRGLCERLWGAHAAARDSGPNAGRACGPTSPSEVPSQA